MEAAGFGLTIITEARTLVTSIKKRIENYHNGPARFQTLSAGVDQLARRIAEVAKLLGTFPDAVPTGVAAIFHETFAGVRDVLEEANRSMEQSFSKTFGASGSGVMDRLKINFYRTFRATELNKSMTAIEAKIEKASNELLHLTLALGTALKVQQNALKMQENHDVVVSLLPDMNRGQNMQNPVRCAYGTIPMTGSSKPREAQSNNPSMSAATFVRFIVLLFFSIVIGIYCYLSFGHPNPNASFLNDSFRYRPVYKFDGSARKFCYPAYPSSSNYNTCGTTLNASTTVFVQLTKCDNYQVYTYWLWYGLQKSCAKPFDKGHGDNWEHVSVFVKNWLAQKVIFYQHKGWYTRRRGTFERYGERPVVYVGKVGHGSYHAKCTGKCGFWKRISEGCLDSVNYCQGGCGYWDDFRNPGPQLRDYELYNLQPGKAISGISRPDTCTCVSSCKGNDSRVLTTAGCWQDRP